jgi:hypothetical protein
MSAKIKGVDCFRLNITYTAEKTVRLHSQKAVKLIKKRLLCPHTFYFSLLQDIEVGEHKFKCFRRKALLENFRINSFCLNSVGGDPVQEVGHLSVDTYTQRKTKRQLSQISLVLLVGHKHTRVASQSAALTPGDDSVLDGAGTSAGEEGAAGVTLARVDSTYKY